MKLIIPIEPDYPGLRIEITNDAGFSPDAADNAIQYDREYTFSDTGVLPSSMHGVTVLKSGAHVASVILFASGGCTGVHERSAAVTPSGLVVAVGDRLCCLSVPRLDLVWSLQADPATCFGVYYLEGLHCLICHGELEISRISINGIRNWEFAGCDIFSESFEIIGDQVVASDFHRRTYTIDIATGAGKLREGS